MAPNRPTTRFFALAAIAALSFGCARAVPPSPSSPPVAVAPAQPEDEVPQASDPNTEHITFDGMDAQDSGPADYVVAQPERPPMPSMIDTILNGPNK